VYRLTCTKVKQRRKPNAIKKLYELPYTGYVYDLTTANHHFQAGVGCIIVHNTDSNFSCYRIRENIEKVNEEDSLELWKKIIDRIFIR
jgi:hypothetical protein